MRYEYICKACQHKFQKILPMSDYAKPKEEPCPNCSEVGKVDSYISGAPTVMEPHLVKDMRPSGWKEVLKTAHNYAGRHSGIDI